MHTFPLSAGRVPDAAWTWLSATRQLDEAAADLDAAGAGLVSLLGDTCWASEGVRALHERLGEHLGRAVTESAHVAARRRELDGAGGL